ncbi:hypothetical protein PVAP13_3KG479201 [Panicum virgatum]|uniref:Uncharacterized protein n=1 Tax=Panicum virgatum TaxID=38727 RepID=A0A8T0VBV9_PANVG|nr:hypothetical protein PVAP13_3KG479201 [Panicum virgatum]
MEKDEPTTPKLTDMLLEATCFAIGMLAFSQRTHLALLPLLLIHLCHFWIPVMRSLRCHIWKCSACSAERSSLPVQARRKPARLMDASANASVDHGHNMVLFSPVKCKRSKTGIPVLDSEEMCAAAAILMLAEYSDKISAYGDCYGGDNDDNISTLNLLKEVNLNVFLSAG